MCCGMSIRIATLRTRARELREMTELCRRVGSSLSLPDDRTMMLQHAGELEAEAARLQAEADALERDEGAPVRKCCG
jgi:hypothetical protein